MVTFAHRFLNSLPNYRILDQSKMKAYADDRNEIYVTEKLKFVLEMVENIVGKKGGNAGYQHFLLFPTMFSKGFFFNVVKSCDCVL